MTSHWTPPTAATTTLNSQLRTKCLTFNEPAYSVAVIHCYKMAARLGEFCVMGLYSDAHYVVKSGHLRELTT